MSILTRRTFPYAKHLPTAPLLDQVYTQAPFQPTRTNALIGAHPTVMDNTKAYVNVDWKRFRISHVASYKWVYGFMKYRNR